MSSDRAPPLEETGGMSKTDDTLNYTVYLTDAAQVAELQATVFYVGIPAGVIFLSPDQAAAQYSAPILRQYRGATGSPAFVAPCISSPWFEATSPAHFPTNVASGEVDSGGFLGFFKSRHFFHWVGKFEWSPKIGADPITGTPAVAMPQRRWIDGAELPKMSTSGRSGEGASGNGATLFARSASRTLDGFGYHFDNTSGTIGHTPTESGGAATRKMWERFYIRVHRYGTSSSALWSNAATPNTGHFAYVTLNPDGRIALNNVSPVGGVNGVLATSPNALPLGVWQKIDFVYNVNDGTDNANFAIYINGVRAINVHVPSTSGGLGTVQTSITLCAMGDGAGNGRNLTYDIDDWIGADQPTGAALGGLTSPEKDWNYGSHVVAIRPNGFAGDNAASWAAGDWRLLLNRPGGDLDATGLASAIAVARLSVTTDALQSVDKRIGAMGIAGFTVGLFSKRGTLSGQLGYRFAPAAAVMGAISQFATLDWDDTSATAVIMYRPAGIITPQQFSTLAAGGLELVHDKGNDAVSSTVQALHAAAEVIGIFGPEDVGAGITDAAEALAGATKSTAIGKHNAQYPDTPWSNKGGLPPTAPVMIYSGTYVGNSTFQDLAFAAPVQFLVIRVTDASAAPFIWWPSLNAPHVGSATASNQDAVIQALVDPTFVPGGAQNTQQMQILLRLAGAGAGVNLAGKTYHYVAYCDPGIRFCNAGASDVLVGADYVQALDLATFNPDVVFSQVEQSGASATHRMYVKGLGSAGNVNVTPIDGAIGSGMSKAAGSITWKAGLLALTTAQNIGFIAFRRDDGSGDVGVPNALQLASYVGDGSGSRTINLAPASGVRPLFALITGGNGVSYQRDPSHTGTNSQQWPNTATATGITGGGVDSISVGASLNTNGVQFDVFVIPGVVGAGNGGWSAEPVGPIIPVDPVAPPGGAGTPWDVTPNNLDPDPVDTSGTTVEPGGDSTDFGDQCVVASTKIINQALSHIGVTKQILDVTTEQSNEAQEARLHFSDDLSSTLRDFPWPFATRYAVLLLVAGSEADPVNGDWTYSYRAPDNMMLARRIVNPNGVKRAFDPDPVDFRVGGDATGTLIYTNQASTDDGADSNPQLEYTVRPSCAASQGDALFREMLAYRHAATLAFSLARDEKKASAMMAIYDVLKQRAQLAAVREAQQDPAGDAEWLTGRGGY